MLLNTYRISNKHEVSVNVCIIPYHSVFFLIVLMKLSDTTTRSCRDKLAQHSRNHIGYMWSDTTLFLWDYSTEDARAQNACYSSFLVNTRRIQSLFGRIVHFSSTKKYTERPNLIPEMSEHFFGQNFSMATFLLQNKN